MWPIKSMLVVRLWLWWTLVWPNLTYVLSYLLGSHQQFLPCPCLFCHRLIWWMIWSYDCYHVGHEQFCISGTWDCWPWPLSLVDCLTNGNVSSWFQQFITVILTTLIKIELVWDDSNIDQLYWIWNQSILWSVNYGLKIHLVLLKFSLGFSTWWFYL